MKLAGLMVAMVVLGCSPAGQREICGNGKDDDGNGFADCNDPDCAGQAACFVDAGYFGTCGRCGGQCARQSDCLSASWGFDRPLPECLQGICQTFSEAVEVRLELDTQQGWSGFGTQQSVNTRFVKKTAKDGSAVTCARLEVAAANKTEAFAGQIETNGDFSIQGYDVTRLQSWQGGQAVVLPFVNVATGGDYLIWVELWYGAPDSNTKLPSGNRGGWGCYETDASLAGGTLAPVVRDDNCPSGTSTHGTCRTFRVKMPGPR